jgi:hypothetical protein
MEKLILDDFYRTPPMTFALLGFYDSDGCGLLDGFFSTNKYIPLSTTQWYDWNPRLRRVSEDDPILNLIFSFSRYRPSIYRPGIINRRSPRFNLPIYYINAPAFGGFKNVSGYLEKVVLDKPLLLPPNFFFGDEVVATRYRYFLENLLVDDIDIVSNPVVSGLDTLDRRLRDLGRLVSSPSIIAPIVFNGDSSIGLFYRVFEEGRLYTVSSPIFEADDFVIDPFGIYHGGKFRVYFSYGVRPRVYKGFSIRISLNFMDFLVVGSRMFLEVRYGGKVLASTPSHQGIVYIDIMEML